MLPLYERIENFCKSKNVTITEMCRAAGVPRSALSDYKAGRKKSINLTNMGKMADYFGVSIEFLMGTERQRNIGTYVDASNAVILEDERLVRFPVIGSISAGYCGLALEEYTGDFEYLPLSELHGAPDNYFILKVKGDSMYPRLLDGDRVAVRRTSTVENGKVAVVLYNGDEATIKKVNYDNGKNIELIPYNPEYQIRRIDGSDLEQCKILGEVVKLIRNM